MWAPMIKEHAAVANRMGRVPAAVVIKEGFLEEAASKLSLETCTKIAVTLKFLIYKSFPLPPFPNLTGLFNNFYNVWGPRGG